MTTRIKNKFLVKYGIIISLVAFFALIIWIVFPYIMPVITACILAYIVYPVYESISKFLRNRKRLASILTVILVLIVIIIPLAVAIATAAQTLSKDIKIIANSFTENEKISAVTDFIYQKTGYNIQSREFINTVSQNLFNFGREFVLILPDKFISIFVILFLLYYLFMEGPELVKKTYEIMPFKPQIKDRILKDFKDVTFAVVYGNLISAIAQAAVGFIGYLIFGVSGAFFFTILTGLFSFIPFLGAGSVWITAAVILFLKGQVIQAIGLSIYGTFVISLIDNIIKPKIIGDRTSLHPALVLIGVLGGIKAFGIVGIFVGPLFIAIFITVIKTMKIFIIKEENEKYKKTYKNLN
jgi:predicted PurR-regulated permease PerM